MSRKTVSRGATAAALATLLTLASAAPSFAAPRRSGDRGRTAQTGVWSLVVDLSQRLAGWAFGLDRRAGVPGSPSGVTEKLYTGMDPNGNELAADPSEPIDLVPVPGGG